MKKAIKSDKIKHNKKTAIRPIKKHPELPVSNAIAIQYNPKNKCPKL